MVCSMQMGKSLMYDCDPKHQLNLKPINKNGVVKKKKSVKITYITSPLLMRACDASEFRSVVQQLTGKDSTSIPNHHHHQSDDTPQQHKDSASSATLTHCKEVPDLVPIITHQELTPACSVMQQSGEEGGNNGGGGAFYDNRSIRNPLEFDEDCFFWKDLALSFLQSSSVFAIA